MFDQRLWNTHIHLREQQFMREAESDRLSRKNQQAHVTLGPISAALRDAFAIFRARLTTAALAGTAPANRPHPTASKEISSLLAEAEDVVRLHWIETPNAPSECPCGPC